MTSGSAFAPSSLKLTPIERPLLGRGRVVKRAEKYVDLEGTLEDLETGEVVARAAGRFFALPGAQ